jgi:hypothetical protein
MGLENIRDDKGDFKTWAWTGDVRGLVNAVASGDARLGFVLDKKSGAKISMNISDGPPEGWGSRHYEPFYIESPDGEIIYDAYNRKEAVTILSNIRKGMEYPDMGVASLYPPGKKYPTKKKHAKKKKARREPPEISRISVGW